MSHTLRFTILLATVALLVKPAGGQVATGTPPFGSFSGGPDVTNLANLNSHIIVPVLSKPGRGTDFTYDLTYDSSVWYPLSSGSSRTWTPVITWGWRGVTEVATGYVSYNLWTATCVGEDLQLHNYTVRDTWAYHDPFGATHNFDNLVLVLDVGLCSGITQVNSDTATDGSGYSIINATQTHAPVYSSADKAIVTPINQNSGTGSATDRNGNKISVNSSAQFFDTLSSTTPVLTVAGSGTPASPTTFTYTVPSGGAVYTMKYTSYTVRTNFGCTGITEYGSAGTTTANLVSEVDLPDGSKYTFAYETTPSDTHTPHHVTGRLASVTLPTGGTISYTYSAGNNGIICSDGSTATLTRATPDGTWTYAQVKGTGAASTTTVSAPQLPYDSAANQTVIQFQGIYETQRKIYQGSSAGTLLSTINTCYNGATMPCTTTAVARPITQRNVNATIPGAGALQSFHIDKFDSFGNQTESDDYDFATGAPFPIKRQMLISYASLGNNLNAFRQTVTIKDGGGVIKFRQDTNYDQYSSFTGANCITGVAQHDDTGHGCSFTARANVTSTTNYTDPATPGGAVIKNFTYDSLGNLRTAQLNCCQQKTWVYSATTSYAYADSITSGSSSPQLTTSFLYDLNLGLVTRSTNANNIQTNFAYDNMGRVTSSQPTTTPATPATTYTYTDSGNWSVQACSPVQGTSTACQKTIFDSQGRPATIQLTDGTTVYSATNTAYDPLGRAYKASNPYTSSPAYWTQTNFDALGRPVSTTLPDNSANTITYTDNTTTASDPTSKQRKFVTDGLARLASVYEPDPASGNTLTLQTSYTYNVHDELTQVTQGSQTRAYVYDALWRLVSATTPEAGMVCFGTVSGGICQQNGYDSFNNLLYRTDARGVVTNYLYDSLNRITGIAYPTIPSGVAAMPNVCKANGSASNNANVCFSYGTSAASLNNGRLISMADSSGSESHIYDQFGNTMQLAKIIGTTTYTTTYSYNLANELTQITYPSSRVVVPSYDAIGRPCAVGTSGSTCTTGTLYASAFGYNVAQQVTDFKYGNGLFASSGFSSDRLQLTCLDYSSTNRSGSCTHDGTTKFGLTYSYGSAGSNNGQIIGITDSVDSGRSMSYTYDALYRLTRAVSTGSTGYPAWGLSMTYDRYGNRSAQSIYSGCVSPMTCPTNSMTIDSVTNRISGDCYDASGNLLAESAPPCPSPTYTFDGENRLAAYSTAASYSYDGKGLRIRKCVPNCTSPTSSTVYLFSGSKVIAEYDNGASPTSPSREYIYSGSMLLAKIDAGGTKYYHEDHLSNRLVTDSSGNTLAQLGHFPSGEAWYNSTGDKFVFTTYERDSESSNDYAMARYNMSRLGRFSSPDPIAGSIRNPQSFNRYTYALNWPTQLTDRTGLTPSAGIACLMDDIGNCRPGSGSGGSCTIDGFAADCGLASGLLDGEGGMQCPNNVCSGVGVDAQGNTVFAQFYAFAGGASGYFNPSDVSQGVWEWGGRIYSASGWTAYLENLRELAKEALTNAISLASNSSDGSNWDQIYKSLDYKTTTGGNADFTWNGTTTDLDNLNLDPALQLDSGGCKWSCRDGSVPSLHFNDSSFHLDTANPSWGFGLGLFIHGFADFFLGHINPSVPMVH
jgi:RHS repeat-associated protein